MSGMLAPRSVHRDRPVGEAVEVGPIELFFDLVYVFIIIQMSHHLLEHLTWTGALQTAVLFAAVWWAWNYSAWAMNWLEPGDARVRVLLAVLMLAALGMGVALPHAFEETAGLFVGSYVALQVIRSGYLVLAFRGHDAVMRRNYEQLLAWSVFASVFWVAGVFAGGDARLVWWLVAVVVDYVAPWVGFVVPGRGPTPMSAWSLRAEHLAERNRLVFIISLGETILILGFTLSGMEALSVGAVTATVLGFVLLVLLWWVYFDHMVPDQPDDPGRSAEAGRAAFAYGHAAMVGGAIVVAVAIELVVAHPHGHVDVPMVLTMVAGPLLYLAGNLVALRAQAGERAGSREVAMIALAVVGAVAVVARESIAPLLALTVVVALMAGLAVADRSRSDVRA